jgi:hypothetical protein
MKALHDATVQYETDRKAIFDKLCDQIDGKPDLRDNKYHFSKKNTPVAESELKTLNEETVELPNPEGIKEILERTNYSPLIGEADVIDSILTKF